ncbi:DUF4097 family beta strand repeat-containing protein [Fictibacillus sp. Mic-4]|uniref:DUF4097 family beta strand repeat-containing protein n=1 Tax=Fictibacillus TaxID=1329200 RepID=UPI0003FA2257|nr:DUF4097 family beta strand repeat-containing protein [Fictibacillus gelatini]
MRKWMLISAIVFLAGIVGLVSTAVAKQDFSFSFLYGKTVSIDKRKSVSAGGIDSVNVSAGSSDVKIVPAKKDAIDVHLMGKGNKAGLRAMKFSVKQEGSQLLISLDSRIGFGIRYSSTTLTISVPEKVYKKIMVDISSGDASVRGVKAEQVQVETSSGDIHIAQVSGKKIKLGVSSGDITGEHLEGDIAVHADSGNTELSLDTIKQNIAIDGSSGDVTVNVNKAPSSLALDFDSSSGTGNVNLPMNYQTKSDNSIHGKLGSGKYALKVDISSGDFDFNVK